MTEHKAIIETLINSAAIALSAYGIGLITKGVYQGYIAVGAAVILEFIKYYGRKVSLW